MRRIHGPKAPVSPPPLCPTAPPNFHPLQFFPCLALSFSFFHLLEFLLSFSLSSLLVGSKRSSVAAATVAIVVLVGAKLPQFCTFYTAREKKEDNFWWKRNNFIGRCYVRSVGVYCRCALHLSASCAPIRDETNAFPNVTLTERQLRDIFSTKTYIDRSMTLIEERSPSINPAQLHPSSCDR